MELKTTGGASKKLRSNYAMILIPICIAVNVVGGLIANNLKLPIFLDSIGTCLSAVILGPLLGAATGFMTQLVVALINGEVLVIAFGLVQIGVGLTAGLFAKFGLFKKWWHLIPTTIVAAFMASLIAAPVATFLFGGVHGQGVDFLVAGLLASGKDIFSSTFLARIPANLVDKGVALVISFIILQRLPDQMKNLISSKKKEKTAAQA